MNIEANKAKELLLELVEAGKIDLDDIKDIKSELDSARRRYFTNKRSPESYEEATRKAKATIKRSTSEREGWSKKAKEISERREADRLARKEGGLLPQTISGYGVPSGKKISRELYKESPYDNTGYGTYHLYSEYENLILDKEIAEFYWSLE